jgi:general secretion pathway protein L
MTSLRPAAATASALLGAFGRWWLAEFLALFPAAIAKWLVGGGRVSLVLEAQEETVTLDLVDDGRQPIASESIPRADYSPVAIERFLAAHGLARKEVAVGIRLRREQVFGRKLILPVEAARSLDAVATQDLTTRTPFRPDAVYHDHATQKATEAGRVVLWQWIARRDLVEDALTRLELDRARVAFIDAAPNPDEPAPRIVLARTGRARRPWARTAALALASSAVLLAVAAAGLEYRRQAAILDDLERQLTAARARAQQVRAAFDKLEQKQAILFRLRTQKAERPGLLDAWDEATRLLPPHSWLTELRLVEAAGNKDPQVAMTGFSAAASSLVGLIAESSLFADASLTAPIAVDPVEKRERFALQAKLSGRNQVKRAAR